MEETTNASPVPESPPALRVGAVLREKRLAMGLSVADISAQIRWAPRQIEALEADDFDHLPELPFVRGFVRSYAKLLHLDDQPLLATMPDPHGVSERIEPVSVEVPFNIKKLSKQQNQNWLIASAGVAVIVLAFAWWHFTTPKTAPVEVVEKPVVLESAIVLPEQTPAASGVAQADEPVKDGLAHQDDVVHEAQVTPVIVPQLKSVTTLTPSPAPVQPVAPAVKTAVTAPVTPPSVETGTSKLRIVFDSESWSEIKDATGKILSSQINAPGSELNLNGKAPYDLVIGHAPSVHVYRRGKPVDLSDYINSSSEVARLTLE